MWVHVTVMHPYVVDGDGHHPWKVAANILNRQSQTANKGSPLPWGLGEGLELLTKETSLL
jgi:hypothetical protein